MAGDRASLMERGPFQFPSGMDLAGRGGRPSQNQKGASAERDRFPQEMPRPAELAPDNRFGAGQVMASGFHAGAWVEIRPLAEVLKTLGRDGTLDGLPFMPEMARLCGRRFKVAASAHKTCDPTGETDMRRMKDAVHLETRCDGGAHGGCEARCRFYWKTAWLASVDGPAPAPIPPSEAEIAPLHAFTSYQTDADIRYRCQGTEIVRATQPGRNLGQYAKDIRSGNITFGYFLRHVSGQFGKAAWSRLMRLSRRHAAPTPCTVAAVAGGQVQARLNLLPGESVRVRPAKEIAATLDK